MNSINFKKLVMLHMVCLLVITSTCGGGGGGKKTGGEDPINESESVAADAYTLLKEGSVNEAMAKYDEALALNPDDTTSAFGAALARLILLGTSEPTNNLLASVGQEPAQLSEFLGADGYLAARNQENQIEVSLDGLDGPFFGWSHPYTNEWSGEYPVIPYPENITLWDRQNEIEAELKPYGIYWWNFSDYLDGTLSIQELDEEAQQLFAEYQQIEDQLNETSFYECAVNGIDARLYNADESVMIYLSLDVHAEGTRDGQPLNLRNPVPGETIDYSDTSKYREACGGFRSYPLLVSIRVAKDNFGYKSYYSEGSYTLNSISSQVGESYEIVFNNLAYSSSEEDNDETPPPILNGRISDVLNDPIKYADYTLPFANLKPISKAIVLGQIQNGVTSEAIQSYLNSYIPLMNDIDALLEKADVSDDFQFVIPKELFFGLQDMPLNRADLKAMRAGIKFSKAGFNLANAWSFSVDIDNLYNEAGKRVASKQEIVDQLNDSFALKADHRLGEAQVQVTEGLDLLISAHEVISEISVDGIIEDNPQAEDGFAEARAALEVIRSSLASQQIFPYVEPVVNLNLENFFTNPPDANEIDFDPFVIEDGKIKLVEVFFEQALEGIVDYDMALKYKMAFVSINRAFAGKVFDEFNPLIAIGEVFNP